MSYPPSRDSKATAASKEENIYIPQFITKRPFYATEEGESSSADYLEHQRLQKKDQDTQWYKRGQKAGPAASKYRKGACENCGAMTHKQKDCLSRPRAKGAKWTGKDIQADEVIQDVRLGWDAKRDRWNGYDSKDYMAVVEEHDKLEALKKEVQKATRGSRDDDEEDTSDKYAEANDMSKHQSTATRQLRIREDTAKYLLNLDLDSAKYDPKTRSLVDAGATNDKAAEVFAEQGFMRESGDAQEFEKAQRYAWEQQEGSGSTAMHVQANPTAGEIQRRKLREEEERLKAEKEKLLLDMYGVSGGQEMPGRLKNAVVENEAFVEYDDLGLVKGAPRKIVKSRYVEDVFPNNHTSVFGSWWSDFKWGYSCCHSFVKNSYCTGEDGIRAWEASERQRRGEGILAIEAAPEQDDEPRKLAVMEKAEKSEFKREKTKKRAADMMDGVTEEDLEDYRRKRTAADDPMAKMLGKDELL